MRTRRTLAVITACSALAMLVFLALFLRHNAPGLNPLLPLVGIALLFGLAYLGVASWLACALWRAPSSATGHTGRASRILASAIAALLLYLFLDATVLDYYQPVSLFDDVIAALALAWGLLVIVLLLTSLAPRSTRTSAPPALALGVLALAGTALAAALPLLYQQAPGPAVVQHGDVFVGGRDGYDVYRIPGLLVLPAGASLANGSQLASDRILAFAEARRDGALDTGVIDLVLKTSDDGGASWSPQQVVCRYISGEKRGKCGNPTPVFDTASGQVLLAYNLSGVVRGEHPRHHSARLLSSPDGGATWAAPRELADDNLVFGPGHGIRKRQPPHAGRLLLPGYVDGHAMVLYSDDHGASWQRSQPLDTGNETEVAELADGRLYLATRHNAPIGRPPAPGGRLYSLSTDGGTSWTATRTDTRLATPVCQASVHSHPGGALLFANPAHHRARVQLTVRASHDAGQSWPDSALVYPGPAGYSVLATDGDGDILVLYERGALSYSERISLARLPPFGSDPLPAPRK